MIEFDGDKTLIADLAKIAGTANVGMRAVIAKGAQNIKDEAAATISGHRHIPHYPRSISYDVRTLGPFSYDAEIGPDKERTQGALGNILEYGTSKNPPHPHLGPALEHEGPRLEAAVLAMVAGLL